MAKKIDLKNLDWASVLLEAVVKTRRSYEKSRDNGRLRADIREVIHAYGPENENDEIEDDDLEDDDLEDEDLEDDDLNPDNENPSTSKRSTTYQEDGAAQVHLREQVIILRERLAASEERLDSERALAESTRRESSEREARFVTRERELMGLLGEALRGGALARVTSRETTQPATTPAWDENPAPPLTRDENSATTIPPQLRTLEESADVTESDADVAQKNEVYSELEVDLADAGSPAFDSSKSIDVELVIPDEPGYCAQIEEDDIGEGSAPVAQAAANKARDDVIAQATDEESDQLPDLAGAGQASHREHGRPDPTHTPEIKLLPADPLGRADAALRRGDYVEARELFETLEAKGCEFGPEGKLVPVTIRRGLAESCLGLRDLQRALWESRQALSAASSNLKAAPSAVNLFNYLSSARVRGMVLLATGDPLRARTLLQRACVHADRCGLDLSQVHENELGVMVYLIEGIESSQQLKDARKPGRGRKTPRGRKTGRGRRGRGQR